MTTQELLAAYPTITVAVAYTECIICQPSEPGMETSWEMMLRAQPPMTLDEILECITSCVKEEVEQGNKCRAAEAYQQMQLPEYRQYIAGKLGMM